MTTTTNIEALAAKHYRKDRVALLELALADGADEATLDAIASAERAARGSEIEVPLRYGGLSRSKTWARHGRGVDAQWGDCRGDVATLHLAGRWTVYSHDGFRRVERKSWEVRHIVIGEQTWTIAD